MYHLKAHRISNNMILKRTCTEVRGVGGGGGGVMASRHFI